MKRLVWLALFAIVPDARPQQLPPVEEFLDRLYDYSAQYTATLPSLSCNESIVSQQMKNGKVKWQVRIEGAMREIRTENPADPFHEQHQFLTVNGRPAKKHFETPYFIRGGFANLIEFRHPEMRQCLEHRISPSGDGKTIRIDTELKADAPQPACKAVWPGSHWMVIADENGHVLHSERRISSEDAEIHDQAYFAAMDYAPQQFGDRTFWLPAKFYSQDADDQGRMYATYSNCHRYAGELRILPDTVPETPPAQPR